MSNQNLKDVHEKLLNKSKIINHDIFISICFILYYWNIQLE